MSNTATTEGIIDEDVNSYQDDVNYATGEVADMPRQLQSSGALVVHDAIQRMQSGSVNVYSTVQGTDFGAKMKVLSAVNTAAPIMENLNKHIDLENIVVQAIELVDRITNVTTTQPRVILLDSDGTAYYGISPVLLKAIETFVGVLGQPHEWPEPVGVKVTREKGSRGFAFFNLVLDPTTKKTRGTSA